ncbi:hypothetical protein BT93_A0647 [Corymbia citriodora subsp. variegata]|nr:hypothetical protein BT93_A0647 [Corymbia citriodora subsp. variegata]
MRKRSSVGGFEFTPSPLPTPYRNLKAQAGDVLMNKQIKECEEGSRRAGSEGSGRATSRSSSSPSRSTRKRWKPGESLRTIFCYLSVGF